VKCRRAVAYLGHAFLVCTHSSDNAQRPRINLGPPIANDANHDLLPAVLPPSLAPVPLTQMSDVLDDAVHTSTEELFVLIVHGHNNEEFCAARGVVMYLTEGEAGVFKVVGVTGCC
jgi:hypothetical protein